MKVSVITPSLNPRADYLARVFSALNTQTLPKDEWEYILVDSGSEPPLKGRIDVSWHPNGRIVEAPLKALVRSRLKGMEEAAGDLLLFVDDDNVLDNDYLEAALRFMEQKPFVGVVGAFSVGEFEINPEPWMRDFFVILSAMQFCEERQLDVQYAMARQGGPWIPAGGGMVVRREVVTAYRRRIAEDPRWLEIGRIGEALVGSEDADLMFTAVDVGYAIASTVRLRLTHLIPARRLNLSYLRRLLYASNYGTARLLVMRGWKQATVPMPTTSWQRLLKILGGLRTRSPGDQCWAAFAQGYRDGLAGLPYNKQYQ